MSGLLNFVAQINIWILLFLCLTLGLAPMNPPHIVEKLGMLFKGDLVRPIDWFDLFLHGSPWVLLILKAVMMFRKDS